MKKVYLFFLGLILIGLAGEAWAVPPLPNTFYGTVKKNGTNVSNGTVIGAWIGGIQYATNTTSTYGGVSVYSIHVPGDDPDTGPKEGGVGGVIPDTVSFTIGGVIASQTAVFSSGSVTNLDLTATDSYTVTASAGANGSLDGSTSSPATVNDGSTTSFKFNANANYHVASVSGCGGAAYNNTSNAVTTYTYTTGAITSDCTVSATFAINQYTVTASAGANGSLDGSTSSPATVNDGSTTSFKFNANANYHVASVSGCGGAAYNNTSNAVTTYTYTTGAITSDCTVSATFAINQYTVTASAGANGSLDGSTSSPATVNDGSTTSFKFNANANYHVASVSGCGGAAYNNTSNAVTTYTYTTGAITSDCTVSATFAINQYTVTASAGANGSLDGSTSSPATVNDGSTTSFKFNANANYHVASVSGCGGAAYNNTSNAVTTYTYTTGAITSDCTVSATFAINQYTVTASAGANGSLDGSTSSPATVNDGSTTSFKFNANANYHVASVSGCGGAAYNNTSNAVTTYTYTTGAITSDCTVSATFAINQYTVTALVGGDSLGGSVTPSSRTVNHGSDASFTVTTNVGYTASVSEGTLTGTAWTIPNVTSTHTVTVSFLQSLTVLLKEGYNLVSFATIVGHIPVTQLVSPIDSQFERIYAYDGSTPQNPWMLYDRACKDNPVACDLESVDNTMGFWIEVNADTSLTVEGLFPSTPSIPLYIGWNLISYPGAEAKGVALALSSISGKYQKVYSYRAGDMTGPWKVYDVSAPSYVNSLVNMEPGFGYWIYINENCTLGL